MNASTPFLGSSAWMPAAVQLGQLGVQNVKNAPNLAPRNMRHCVPEVQALLTEGTSSLDVHFTKVTASESLARHTPRALSENCLQAVICDQPKEP